MASGTISAGKNIRFLLGTQANLDKYITKTNGAVAVEGTFYLTNDTHRLYIGTAEGKAVPVNEGVITVADIQALSALTNPHAGEFYYATTENVLCVYNGRSWVQINNNTNTYLIGTDASIALADNVATITTKYTENGGNVNNALTNSWKLAVAEGIKIAVDTDNDKITLTGVVNSGFSASAASNIATISLKDSFNNSKAFKIKSGNAATMTVGASGDTTTLTVKDMSNTGVAVSAEADGFKVSVTDAMGTKSGTFSPEVKVGSTDAQAVTVTFKNGTVTLPVYTKAEVDNIHLALNAMTYKGLAGASASANQVNWNTQKDLAAAIGDTYLFAENVSVTIGSETRLLTKGALAIARGVEDSTGKIPAGSVIWDYVESTTDTDTKYKLKNTATTSSAPGSVQLVGSVGGTTESKEKVSFVDGTATKANVTVDASGNATVKFNHANVTSTGTEGTVEQNAALHNKSTDKAITTTEITALESITVNAQGHVTGFKTNAITLKDTNATIKSVGISVGAAKGATSIELTNSVQLTDGAGNDMTAKTGKWSLQSETLVFNQKSNTSVGIDLVWGSFN